MSQAAPSPTTPEAAAPAAPVEQASRASLEQAFAQKLQISYKALLYKIKECEIVDPRLAAMIEDTPPS